jgi:hypothetical protein
MKRKWAFLLFCVFSSLWADPYEIVFVHIGDSLPPYLEMAISQARLFNEECLITLIASEKALQKNPCSACIPICYEQLPITPEHREFQKRTPLREEYMRYTSERFLYLYDYMKACNKKNVFHLENDVLLYVDLKRLLPTFQKHYPGIATTFENSEKCVAGFVFISEALAMQRLAKFFAKKAVFGMADMKVLAQFWKEQKPFIDCLPTVMPQYLVDRALHNLQDGPKTKMRYSKWIEEFCSLFDGASIGVFLDGLDPAKGKNLPGSLVMGVFDPKDFCYMWKVDEEGRKIPYLVYGDYVYRINNLHIASKRLEKFLSL